MTKSMAARLRKAALELGKREADILIRMASAIERHYEGIPAERKAEPDQA